MTDSNDLHENFPIGATVRVRDLEFDPYPILKRLQEHEPVSWVHETRMWFVTRRDDVIAVLKDSATYTTDSPDSTIRDTFGSQMLNADGELQQRFRAPFNPFFRPKSIRESMLAKTEKHVNALIAAFRDLGSADLGPSFAAPLAVETVAGMLGFPAEDAPGIRSYFHDFAAALANFERDDSVRARGHESAEIFRQYVHARLKELRSNHDGSVLGSMLTDPDNALSDDELVANTMITLFGGIETTEALILNAVWSLLAHPEQLKAVAADPSLVENAVEESLRWQPAVQSCTRHATRDAELRGNSIRKGQIVQCMIGAANRDPDYYHAPDTFDIHRANARDHLAFGLGRHMCLGAALARLEGQLALTALLQQLPELTLDHNQSRPPKGHEFRKPEKLIVRWNT